MNDDLSFKAVCNFLKKQDQALLDTVDAVLGPAILLSALTTASLGGAGAMATASSILGAKSAMVTAGKKLLAFISTQNGQSLNRFQRIQIAHCLIVYTAFFETLEKIAPRIDRAFGLSAKEKAAIIRSAEPPKQAGAAPNLTQPQDHWKSSNLPGTGLIDEPIALPHPTESIVEHEERISLLYRELTRSYTKLVQGLSAYENADDKKRRTIDTLLEGLPELSLATYRDQYIALGAQFPEFFIWQTTEHQKFTQLKLVHLDKRWQKQLALSEDANKVDIGLKRLQDTVDSISSKIEITGTTSAIMELSRLYADQVQRPLIEEDFSTSPEAVPLRFPKRSEAFIPQSFRVLRVDSQKRLENEETWEGVDIRNDLSAFLLSYFSSPYSFKFPLLILGDPGSGKSLLTHMLAARLIGSGYTPIRVALRALQSDEIANQIEEQIFKDTNGQRVSWPALNHALRDSPALVLLDGYDELLQASGKTYAGYLNGVRQFQETEQALGRSPVRAIVTSRITLIDKTRIPAGTTVLRLEAFDEIRRQTWIDVWNQTNAEYFLAARPPVRPFRLQEDDEKIVELAQQPLLLLMLALYDSSANELDLQKGLNRTRLYDNLLRRFIERELTKSSDFRDLGHLKQQHAVDSELDRLSVVAISMFNRRSLLIRTEELEVDLKFFGFTLARETAEGRSLRQSDLLLGSFFFVHESRSTSKNTTTSQQDAIESSFQFLHNTFGEFLAARFIIERTIEQANKIFHLSKSPVLRPELERKLSEPDGLDTGWLASLMFTPLFSRIVVLEMVREWLPFRIIGTMTPESFRSAMDQIILSELHRFLERGQFPSLMKGQQQSSFSALPLIGHLAIYSNNLLILRTVVPDGEFYFDESSFTLSSGGTRPWESLTHIWRAWFSVDSLYALTAVLNTRRVKDGIQLEVKDRFILPARADRLDAIRDTGHVLADEILSGLATLETWDPLRGDSLNLSHLLAGLHHDRFDLRLEVLLKQCQSLPPETSGLELEDILSDAAILIDQYRHSRPNKALELIRVLFERIPALRSHQSGQILTAHLIDFVSSDQPAIYEKSLEIIVDFKDPLFLPVYHEEMIDLVFRRFRNNFPESQYAKSLKLRLAAAMDAWPLAHRLINEYFGSPTRAQLAIEELDLDFGPLRVAQRVDPEAILVLAKLCATFRSSRTKGTPKATIESLWSTQISPSVVVGLPTSITQDILRLLPSISSKKFGHSWIGAFFRALKKPRALVNWPSSSSAIVITAADVALKLGSRVANPWIEELITINPKRVLGWINGPKKYADSLEAKTFLGQLEIESLLRILRSAQDKSQAARWLLDAIKGPLVGVYSGNEPLPAGIAIETAMTFQLLDVGKLWRGLIDLGPIAKDLDRTIALLAQAKSQLQLE